MREIHNIYESCIEPLVDTWVVTKRGGEWDISLSIDLHNTSVKERNTWCAQAMMSTIKAFSSLARVYLVYFDPRKKFNKLSQDKTTENIVDGRSYFSILNQEYFN